MVFPITRSRRPQLDLVSPEEAALAARLEEEQRAAVPADRYGPRVRGGGRMSYVAAPVEARGTTNQVCGLYPFAISAGAPLTGIPMGRHQRNGGSICFDPISWYEAGLTSNPNVFIAGQPGLGKSQSVRRMVLGYAYMGVTSLVLGDLKPDYANLIEALGGQVIRIGPGRDRINPLDAGPWRQALHLLDERSASLVRDAVISRRRNMVEALGTLVRRRPLDDGEVAVLAAAIRHLAANETDLQPTLRDVVDVIQQGPPEVRRVTLDRGDEERYREATDALMRTLLAIIDGPLGATFNGQTTVSIDLDTVAVCVDISHIGVTDEQLTAGALLASWSYGFAQVEAAHLLADLGLAPKRRFFTVMDELWRALRAPGLVDRLDGLTRLSRAQGTGLAYITHSLDDLEALEREADVSKARGIAERCAAKLLGGLSREQLLRFSQIVELSESEISEVTSWADQEGWTRLSGPVEGALTKSPGVGKFLLKIGSRPGLPVYLDPTAIERKLGDTDARFRVEK
jgi:hypothetical protein